MFDSWLNYPTIFKRTSIGASSSQTSYTCSKYTSGCRKRVGSGQTGPTSTPTSMAGRIRSTPSSWFWCCRTWSRGSTRPKSTSLRSKMRSTSKFTWSHSAPQSRRKSRANTASASATRSSATSTLSLARRLLSAVTKTFSARSLSSSTRPYTISMRMAFAKRIWSLSWTSTLSSRPRSPSTWSTSTTTLSKNRCLNLSVTFYPRSASDRIWTKLSKK